jgi:hypothetical protein
VPINRKALTSAAASAATRPGVALAVIGLVIAAVSAVPELLLTAHLWGGGGISPVLLQLLNRLITIATVFGAALSAGGVVLEVRRRVAGQSGD